MKDVSEEKKEEEQKEEEKEDSADASAKDKDNEEETTTAAAAAAAASTTTTTEAENEDAGDKENGLAVNGEEMDTTPGKPQHFLCLKCSSQLRRYLLTPPVLGHVFLFCLFFVDFVQLQKPMWGSR